MEAIGLLVTLEARPGKEADAEAFLCAEQQRQQRTWKDECGWYAVTLAHPDELKVNV